MSARHVAYAALLAAPLAFAAGHAHAKTMTFTAKLTSSAEVPPNSSTGTGTAKVTLDTKSRTINYEVTYDGLTGPATAAHIHGPAAPGKNAGVVVPLQVGPSPITGTATLTKAQVSELEHGKDYVNIHTDANKGGELRGQLHKGM
ncbi:CHRD domain-containing protein [Acidisphaera rubrifaciens]|uniref:CHRD domain-containing protein n=1 Tax=Acidisphaera rubrifaciens HS-AP3 TaxID=1231350 RepID=A0A0D6PBJ8_9PROT|nr:CHRD domain-containing protein [Acidisphaera rubrifaciens]GAN78234.1 hypothetical protein Asru_0695_01 [Acidisphaera rubrifaciens HS-AP3]